MSETWHCRADIASGCASESLQNRLCPIPLSLASVLWDHLKRIKKIICDSIKRLEVILYVKDVLAQVEVAGSDLRQEQTLKQTSKAPGIPIYVNEN